MKLTRNGALLVVYYFVAWLGGTMAWFVQPFYFSSIGYTYSELGVIFSLISVSQAVGFLFTGPVVSKLGYKRSIYLAIAFFSITRAIHVLAPSYALLILASLSFGIGIALETPAFMSLLSKSTENTHTLFSLNWGMATIGGALGTLLGGYLSGLLGYRDSLILAALFLPMQATVLIPVRESAGSRIGRLGFNAPLQRVLLLSLPIAIIGFAGGIILPYMGLWFKGKYGMEIGEVGVVFTLLQFAMGLGSLTAPAIAGRTGTSALIVAFTSLSGLSLALMPFSPVFSIAAFLYALRMFLVNTEVPIWDSFYVSNFSEKERPTALALKGFAWTAAFGAGQFAGGAMFQSSLSLPLFVGGAFHLFSALAFLVTTGRLSKAL